VVGGYRRNAILSAVNAARSWVRPVIWD
jgi:hypothetical protein